MTDETAVTRFQPYEGVEALPREDDPVMLVADTRIYIGSLAERLRKAYLYGGPNGHKEYAKMEQLEQGHLVFVSDAFKVVTDLNTRSQAVGYLLGVREEWAQTDEQWEAARAENGIDIEPRRVEREAYYIQFAANDIARWTNCEVFTVF